MVVSRWMLRKKKKEKSDLEQLMMICCFHIVKEIRERSIIVVIQEKLIGELSKHQSVVQILKDIKNMSIEAKIDNFPKKILDFSPKHSDFIPILAEQQALR